MKERVGKIKSKGKGKKEWKGRKSRKEIKKERKRKINWYTNEGSKKSLMRQQPSCSQETKKKVNLQDKIFYFVILSHCLDIGIKENVSERKDKEKWFEFWYHWQVGNFKNLK